MPCSRKPVQNVLSCGVRSGLRMTAKSVALSHQAVEFISSVLETRLMDQENNVVAAPLCVLGLDAARAGGIHFFPPSSLEDNHHAVKSPRVTDSLCAGTLVSSPSQSPHQQPTWTARLLGLVSNLGLPRPTKSSSH